MERKTGRPTTRQGQVYHPSSVKSEISTSRVKNHKMSSNFSGFNKEAKNNKNKQRNDKKETNCTHHRSGVTISYRIYGNPYGEGFVCESRKILLHDQNCCKAHCSPKSGKSGPGTNHAKKSYKRSSAKIA